MGYRPQVDFCFRLDPGLHALLREEARAENVSLNEYCVHKLAVPLGPFATRGATTEAIERAASCFGEDLIAVVAFGSWARGESSEASDVDLLIVVNDRVELRRESLRGLGSRGARREGRRQRPRRPHRTSAGSGAVLAERLGRDRYRRHHPLRAGATSLNATRAGAAPDRRRRAHAPRRRGRSAVLRGSRAPPATETPLSHRNL